MSDYIDTREGWRETAREEALRAIEHVRYNDGGRESWWVRAVQVPLPTQENTVIRATWKRIGEVDLVLTPENFWASFHGHHKVWTTPAEAVRHITDFEVLARPVREDGMTDEEYRTRYNVDEKTLLTAITQTKRETAEAVINRMRQVRGQGFLTDGVLEQVAREFGVES